MKIKLELTFAENFWLLDQQGHPEWHGLPGFFALPQNDHAIRGHGQPSDFHGSGPVPRRPDLSCPVRLEVADDDSGLSSRSHFRPASKHLVCSTVFVTIAES
jgi:hypothetical protein